MFVATPEVMHAGKLSTNTAGKRLEVAVVKEDEIRCGSAFLSGPLTGQALVGFLQGEVVASHHPLPSQALITGEQPDWSRR